MLEILKCEGFVALLGAIVGGLISGMFSLWTICREMKINFKVVSRNKKDTAYQEFVAVFGALIQIAHPLSCRFRSEYIKLNQDLIFGDKMMSVIANVNLYGSESVITSMGKLISAYNEVIELGADQKWDDVKSKYVLVVRLMRQEVSESI